MGPSGSQQLGETEGSVDIGSGVHHVVKYRVDYNYNMQLLPKGLGQITDDKVDVKAWCTHVSDSGAMHTVTI